MVSRVIAKNVGGVIFETQCSCVCGRRLVYSIGLFIMAIIYRLCG